MRVQVRDKTWLVPFNNVIKTSYKFILLPREKKLFCGFELTLNHTTAYCILIDDMEILMLSSKFDKENFLKGFADKTKIGTFITIWQGI